MKTAKPILRSGWSTGVFALILAVAAAVSLLRTTTGHASVNAFDWVPQLVAVALLIPLAAAGLSDRAEADADGIRWMRCFRRRFYPWSEVKDYYRDGPRSSTHVIGFRDGASLQVSGDIGMAAAFRLFQSEVIRLAPVAEKVGKWECRGTRRCDLPQQFGYHNNYAAWIVIVGLCGILVNGFFGYLGWQAKAESDKLASLGSVILYGVVFGVLIASFAGMRRYVVRHSREKITTSEGGISFYDGHESLFIAWEDIVGYGRISAGTSRKRARAFAPNLQAVRAYDGRLFEYSFLLNRADILKETLRRFAAQACEAKIDNDAREAVGGVAARWTGGVEGVGDRVFSELNRSTLSMCARLIFASGVIFLLPTILLWQDLSWALRVTIFGLFTAIVGFLGSGVFFAWKNKLLLGKDAVTIRRYGRSRRVSFVDIVSCECEEPRRLRLDVRAEPPIIIDLYRFTYSNQIEPLIRERLRTLSESGAGSHAGVDPE